MNLKAKVLLLVAGAVAALNGLLYVATDELVMSGFLRQETNDADRAVRSTREIVGTMVEESLARMTDWAEWDATARFVEGINPNYVEENIEASALAALRWDVVCVAKPQEGTESLAVELDAARENVREVSAAMLAELRNATTHYRMGSPTTGFLVVDDALWITVSRDVKFTDKQPAKVPGRFMTCTRVDEAWLARLRKFTGLAIDFRRLTERPADPTEQTAREGLGGDLRGVQTLAVSEERTSSFCWMPDLYGKPAFLVRVDRDRPLLAQGKSILHSSMLVIASAGLLLLLVTLWGVSRVLRRVDALVGGVEALRAGSAVAVPVSVHDEIGTLTVAFNEMSAKIVDRERSLSAMNDRMKLVLDSTGDGLIPCDASGRVSMGESRSAVAWFGGGDGKMVWDYLFPDDEVRRCEYELGWQQLADDFLPLELLVEQMPRRLRRGDCELALDLRRFEQSSGQAGFLLVVRDITADLERERAERESRELQSITANLLRDPVDFERFLAEMENLVAWQTQAVDEQCRKRNLHTLKGNAAVYGFLGYSEYCHKVEDALAEGQAFEEFAPALQAEWKSAVQRIRQFLPERHENSLWLTAEEHSRFLQQLRRGTNRRELIGLAEMWPFPPVATVFARLGRQASRVAATLGKEITVEAHAGSLRFDPRAMGPFWDAVVHVVRNAVDHGIETRDERLAAGKPAAGRLCLRAQLAGEGLLVQFEDDGRGIAWAAVAKSAERRGLPYTTHEDLVAALFADGLSTREVVSQLSGRGVGLAAVKEACEALGGVIEVQSREGQGSKFAFHFPARHCGDVTTAFGSEADAVALS
ncbi:MAG: Hpt domain-containing protein [Planctomycetes bacterium]|nr:Hpt domain-containing protein [Planctomycetota bacterium]MCC7066728.1 Hpt domain-containing protein [Planctomycetota bacterium]